MLFDGESFLKCLYLSGTFAMPFILSVSGNHGGSWWGNPVGVPIFGFIEIFFRFLEMGSKLGLFSPMEKILLIH